MLLAVSFSVFFILELYKFPDGMLCLTIGIGSSPTLFVRSFRRRFFAYHYASNHPHTNIILSLFSIPLVLKYAAKILKIGLQIKI